MFVVRLAKQGFTLVELLLVVSIFLLIVTFSVIGFKNFAGFQQYNQALNNVEFILNETRLNARSADSDSSHGVKFSASTITQFVGDTYSAVDPTNVVTSYQLVTFSTDFSGGVDEIIFKKLTGLPSATGTIEVSGVTFTAVTEVEVTDTGIVQ